MPTHVRIGRIAITAVLACLLAQPLLEKVFGNEPVQIVSSFKGRKLKGRAAKIPGCILEASQCSIPELTALTRQMQALRQRLVA